MRILAAALAVALPILADEPLPDCPGCYGPATPISRARLIFTALVFGFLLIHCLRDLWKLWRDWE